MLGTKRFYSDEGLDTSNYTAEKKNALYEKRRKKSSWNIGVGYIVDTDVKTLGDGLVANEPLPEGDELRYKTTNQPGGFIITSFSW